MIIEEIKAIKSGKRELRQFGIAIGIVLGLLGGLFLYRGISYYSYFLISSLTFLFLAFVAPIVLKPLQKIWMTLAIIIGWFVTRVILIVLFYLVVTPLALVARLFGKRFLDIRFDKNADSYWMAKKAAEFEPRNYENQF